MDVMWTHENKSGYSDEHGCITTTIELAWVSAQTSLIEFGWMLDHYKNHGIWMEIGTRPPISTFDRYAATSIGLG